MKTGVVLPVKELPEARRGARNRPFPSTNRGRKASWHLDLRPQLLEPWDNFLLFKPFKFVVHCSSSDSKVMNRQSGQRESEGPDDKKSYHRDFKQAVITAFWVKEWYDLTKVWVLEQFHFMKSQNIGGHGKGATSDVAGNQEHVQQRELMVFSN